MLLAENFCKQFFEFFFSLLRTTELIRLEWPLLQFKRKTSHFKQSPFTRAFVTNQKQVMLLRRSQNATNKNEVPHCVVKNFDFKLLTIFPSKVFHLLLKELV